MVPGQRSCWVSWMQLCLLIEKEIGRLQELLSGDALMVYIDGAEWEAVPSSSDTAQDNLPNNQS